MNQLFYWNKNGVLNTAHVEIIEKLMGTPCQETMLNDYKLMKNHVGNHGKTLQTMWTSHKMSDYTFDSKHKDGEQTTKTASLWILEQTTSKHCQTKLKRKAL